MLRTHWNTMRNTRNALSANSLAAWLNHRGPNLLRMQNAIAAYIRWSNAGRPNQRPKAAKYLFSRPLKVRVRDVGGLNLAAFSNSDYGVLQLRDVETAGLLSRMRECPQCAKWFFATDSRRRFCPGTCRQREWRKTDKGRASRAAYMRRQRAKEKKLREAKYGRKFKRGRRKA